MRERAVVHVIEPQHLFVPTLVEVFSEAGLSVDFVSHRLEPQSLLDDRPDIVFLDIDFFDEPVEVVRLTHALVPPAQILVYAKTVDPASERDFRFAGATSVLAKNVERRRVVQGLREAEHRRKNRA